MMYEQESTAQQCKHTTCRLQILVYIENEKHLVTLLLSIRLCACQAFIRCFTYFWFSRQLIFFSTKSYKLAFINVHVDLIQTYYQHNYVRIQQIKPCKKSMQCLCLYVCAFMPAHSFIFVCLFTYKKNLCVSMCVSESVYVSVCLLVASALSVSHLSCLSSSDSY